MQNLLEAVLGPDQRRSSFSTSSSVRTSTTGVFSPLIQDESVLGPCSPQLAQHISASQRMPQTANLMPLLTVSHRARGRSLMGLQSERGKVGLVSKSSLAGPGPEDRHWPRSLGAELVHERESGEQDGRA